MMLFLPLTQPLPPSNQNKNPWREPGTHQKNNRQIMHQAKTFSNKVSNKFWLPMDIIGTGAGLAISEVTDFQALFASFSCIVRDRLSRKASTNSPTGIFKSIANLSKVSSDGICLQLNQTDQLGESTFVNSFRSLYDNFKNSSLVNGLSLQTYIKFTSFNNRVIVCNNRKRLISRITQILWLLVNRPTPRDRNTSINLVKMISLPGANRLGDSHANHLKTKRNITYEYTRPKGRSPSPSFVMPSHARRFGKNLLPKSSLVCMGGIA